MPKIHKIKQGEDIGSIAAMYGFLPETIWVDATNQELKEKREDPNLLYPGDIVTIPDKRSKEESGGTEARHQFRRKGVPAKLRLVLEKDGRPIANEDFTLSVDGEVHSGRTDDSGFLEVAIPPTAMKAVLDVGDLRYELELGGLDPLHEDVGIQERLQNLGFYDGQLDGEVGPMTQQAIAEFQAYAGLESTWELTQETKDRLFGLVDEEHEPVNEGAAEETASTENEPEPTEDVVDEEDENDADDETDDEEDLDEKDFVLDVNEDDNLPVIPDEESDSEAL